MQNNRTKSSFRSRAGHKSFGPNNFSRTRRRPAKLDIHAFIEKASRPTNEKFVELPITHTFNDFEVAPEIKKNLRYKGYEIPTPIQDQAIEPIIEGNDLIGLANTGTGKTAAFLIPLINKVHQDRSQKVLIIAPTRELALQIEAELRQFSWGMKIFYTSVVGGMPIGKQIRSLKQNRPNFIIGTPGRIKDLANRGFLSFGDFRTVVLDEVDRMLDMGFVEEITYFLNQLPQERQSLYFSATMSPRIKGLIESFSKNPVTIQVKSQETSADVEQKTISTRFGSKFDKLKEILSNSESNKVLVFSETKREVERLSNDLVSHGFKAESIHGDKTQGKRQRALADFKESKVDILVATDVAARGLDIKNVSHVINYTVPRTYDDYVHRIGRTGRGGSKGIAITLVD